MNKKRVREESSKKSFFDYLIYFSRCVFAIFILVIVFVLPMIVISGSKSFYQNNLNENCFDMISEKDCRDLSLNALNYIKGKEALDDRYSAQEQSHFADVKIIIDFAKALIFGLLIFVVLYFIALYFLDKTEIFRTLKLSGIFSVLFIALLLLGIIISFSGTFFLFHALIFPQGNWTFPFDSTIIVVFSEQFFVHATVVSFLMSLGGGLMLTGAGYLYNKRNQ